MSGAISGRGGDASMLHRISLRSSGLQLPSRLGRGFEQVAPDLLERFDLLTGEPGGGGDGARFGFVGELAQAVADDVHGVHRVESLVQWLLHVEAEVHQLFRGGARRARRFNHTLAWRRHGETPANPALYAIVACRFCYVKIKML